MSQVCITFLYGANVKLFIEWNSFWRHWGGFFQLLEASELLILTGSQSHPLFPASVVCHSFSH